MAFLRSSTLFSVVAGLVAGSASPALAHVQLAYPAQRYQDQKQRPCGRLNGTRTENVTTLAPGATIDVTWDETVDHVGHFRISFDSDGDDDFVNPTNASDTNPTVLLNAIEDRDVMDGDRTYTATVTLPDIECNNCTLQLIQVMTDAATYTSGDFYYQCADIVLSDGAQGGDPDAGAGEESDAGDGPAGVDAGNDTGDGDGASGDGSEGDASGGCAAGSRSGPGGALIIALTLALLVLRRRRA